MTECPECDADNDIESVAPGQVIKCQGCGVKLEVIKDGRKKELWTTELDN